jgi:DNA polymerase III alpha subunit
MSYDEYGQKYLTEDEIVEMLHVNPDLDLRNVLLDEPKKFNFWNSTLYTGFPKIKRYKKPTCTVEQFDNINQSNWYMPDEYKNFDIMKWLMDQCKTEEEIDRVAEELYLYDDRDLIPLLQFLKYMIDTFREEKVVWGVGRGSSVASYVLYLIGVHKVNSLKYNLDVAEFLR